MANTGISRQKLMKELKNQAFPLNPNPIPVVDRLDRLEEKPSPYTHRISSSTIRACPECAKHLYHTDIYTYPWLTHCPIHKCELTESCPQCKEPWPTHRTVHSRSCELCSMTSTIELLEHGIKPLPRSSLSIIQSLYRFISTDNSSYYLESPSEFGTSWWNVSESDPYFPSFRVKTQVELQPAIFTNLGIELSNVYKKTSVLSEYTSIPEYKYAIKNSNWMSIIRREVLNDLCRKLIEVSGKHSLSISDYRYLSLENKKGNTCPCPYCLALSLWFINAHTSPHGWNTGCDGKEYRFLRELGYLTLYKPGPMSSLITPDTNYATSLAFQKWSYRRDLEISFNEILDICLNLYDHWRKFRLVDGAASRNKDIFSMYRKYYDQQFFLKKSDKLIFYYRQKSPLEDLVDKSRSGINDCCRRYKKVLNKQKKRHLYYFDVNLIDIPVSHSYYLKSIKLLQKTY